MAGTLATREIRLTSIIVAMRVDASRRNPYYAASFYCRYSVRDRIAFVAVGFQTAAVLVCALGAWLIADLTDARFVLLGGASAVTPNALFALRLAMHRGKSPESYPMVFLIGELLKVMLAIALLALVVRGHAQVQWLALLIGWIVALKAPLLLLFWRHR